MEGKVKVCTTTRHQGEVTCLLFDQVLFSGSEDGSVRIWDAELHSKNELNAHAALIYSMATDSRGRLYTSSTDGLIKCFENPRSSDFSQELSKSFDELYCLISVQDDIYVGDDKGNVTWYVDNKEKEVYNVIEEVKSLAVEEDRVYTIKDQDLVISQKTNSGKSLVNRATIPGRYPLILCGPKEGNKHKYVIFCTRDGKGLTMIKNETPYTELWSSEKCHEMAINTMFAFEDLLYTGAFNGKVRRWRITEEGITLEGELSISICINAMVPNADGSIIYVGGSDGAIREVVFE